MTIELVARLPSRSALAQLTRRRVGLVLEGVPLQDHLLVRGAAKDRGALEAERDALGLLHVSVSGAVATYFLPADKREATSLRSLRRLGWAPLSPLRWTRGSLEVRLVGERGDAVERLVGSRLDVEIVSKRRRPSSDASAGRVASDVLLPALTPKQADAVLAALEAGYYESPRRVTTEEIAASLRVSRSTFEDHLRRGEAQLMHSLGPLLRLRNAPAEDPLEPRVLETYAKFSAALGLYVELCVKDDRLSRVRLRRNAPHGAKTRHAYLSRILEHLATGHGDLTDIPVDLEVSAFERDVLDEMRRIPPGQVLTYGELAKRLGKPGAARSVGNACAKNPIPLVIPCHRVVAGDGTIGNYSAEGGKETKEKLLRLEGALPKEPETRKNARA